MGGLLGKRDIDREPASLHPSEAAYKAMADAVPEELLK